MRACISIKGTKKGARATLSVKVGVLSRPNPVWPRQHLKHRCRYLPGRRAPTGNNKNDRNGDKSPYSPCGRGVDGEGEGAREREGGREGGQRAELGKPLQNAGHSVKFVLLRPGTCQDSTQVGKRVHRAYTLLAPASKHAELLLTLLERYLLSLLDACVQPHS